MRNEFCRPARLRWGAIVAVVAVLFAAAGASADPVDAARARRAVRGWLRANPRPFEARRSFAPRSVEPVHDAAGDALGYIVQLEPEGFIITAADDAAEPVIAFSEDGVFDPAPGSPLADLVRFDLSRRLAGARASRTSEPGTVGALDAARAPRASASLRARARWNRLLQAADSVSVESQIEVPSALGVEPMGVVLVSDIRVSPLIQSTWGQGRVGGYSNTDLCYNYYTPNQYDAGCVAIVMAQLMRYHEYPSSYRAIDGHFEYPDWGLMPLSPQPGQTTTAERQEIGYLCWQAGLSVDMEYTALGSSAYLSDASDEMRDTFGFAGSVCGRRWNAGNIDSQTLRRMINPSLDAGLPVGLSLLNSGESTGHAVICDGYAYNGGTMYHHLNMGWDGREDAWYSLPDVDPDYSTYNTVTGCMYNIHPSQTGEIISGRIVDRAGRPVEGVTVNLNGGAKSDVSDSRGIYAFAGLSSWTNYTIEPAHPNWNFTSQVIQTRRSTDDTIDCGNVWAADFVGSLCAGEITLDKDRYTAGDAVTIQVRDDDLADRSSIAVDMQTRYGDAETVTLSQVTSGVGVFSAVLPSSQTHIQPRDETLQLWHGDLITVVYVDEDDGTGASRQTQDQADVDGVSYNVHAWDFDNGLPAGWDVVNGGDGAASWMSDYREGDWWYSGFMIVDSDLAGQEYMDEQLITPSIDCSNLSNTVLRFLHEYMPYHGEYNQMDETADVDIRVNGGRWQNIARYTAAVAEGPVELDISSIADGQADVQIRFHYYNALWDMYWGIDEVMIAAQAPPQPPVAQELHTSAETAWPETIELSARDESDPLDSLHFDILSLPAGGRLYDPGAGTEITREMLPYRLVDRGRSVVYVANDCFEGWVEFSFRADDGRESPYGGASEPALVTVRVWPPAVEHESFDAAMPDDWTITDGYSDGHTWRWTKDAESGEGYLIVDSEMAGSVWMDEQLVSSPFDCSGYDRVYLVFDHYFAAYSDEIADVELRVGNDRTWTPVASYQGYSISELAEYDISEWAAGRDQVRFRWRYHNAYYDSYWVLYHVWILGLRTPGPGDLEGDCDVDLINLAQMARAWDTVPGEPTWDRTCDLAAPFDRIDINDLLLLAEDWLNRVETP